MALTYGTATPLAITSANSLASINTTATAAASSAAATTSTVGQVVDALVQVRVVTPAFTPTASSVVNIYAYASADGTQYPGALATSEIIDGTDRTVTLSTLGNNLVFLGTIQCHTSGGTFTSKPLNIASRFGGTMPKKWGIVLTNALPATISLTSATINYTEVAY